MHVRSRAAIRDGAHHHARSACMPTGRRRGQQQPQGKRGGRMVSQRTRGRGLCVGAPSLPEWLNLAAKP
ncbi:hypothetical protein C6Y62_04175 [Hyphomicrobium sulfonivorans]|nr:hypothetical protein [Hyphomicrobium sulfonivorans]